MGIVAVVKMDGSILLCGDYKVTVIQAARWNKYHLPRIDDIFASLESGKMFSKLDMAPATYQQIPLDEALKKLTFINTTKGLYRTLAYLLGYPPLLPFSRESWKVFCKVSPMCLFTWMIF